MIKVLFLCPIPPPYAGPEIASEVLLKYLPRIDVKYIHLNSNIRKENWQKGKFDIKGVLIFLGKYIRYLKHLLNPDVDAVYLLLSSSLIGFVRDSIYIISARFLFKKVIAHYRGGNFDGFYFKCIFPVKFYIKAVLFLVNVIIVQAGILVKMFDGITNTRIEVLYNGLENNIGFKEKAFNGNETTLLFIGHIAYSKGFYHLVEVYKSIYKKYKLKLLFAGTFRFEGYKSRTQKVFLSGKHLMYFDENKQQIATVIKEFVENCHKYNSGYLGIITGTEKEKAFINSDIYILPSLTEGFSVSVLEAMQRGLPVISSRVGALPEIIKENENGWLCDAGSKESLKEAIIKAVSIRNRWKIISDNNKQSFIESFTVDKAADKLEKIVKNVIYV